MNDNDNESVPKDRIKNRIEVLKTLYHETKNPLHKCEYVYAISQLEQLIEQLT